MHVVAINQFYAPDTAATAQLLTELAEGLVSRGHRVSVMAAATSKDDEGLSVEEGVEVYRVKTSHFGKSNLMGRMADYLSFYAGLLLEWKKIEKASPDVILVMTTPPMIGLWTQVLARFQVPLVTVVQDLYPDVAMALGAIQRRGLPARLLRQLTGLSLRNMQQVVVLSEGMKAHVLRYGVKAEGIQVIPNWALKELSIESEPLSSELSKKQEHFGDAFVVMYSGNQGACHTFHTLLAAAKRLRHRKDIVFLFVGDGLRKKEIEDYVSQEGLGQVYLHPFVKKEELRESLAMGDLHVVTLRPGFDGLVVPSKFYGILAASRPLLFIGPTQDSLARLLEDIQCGTAIEDGEVEACVEAILAWKEDPKRAEKARRGLDWLRAEGHFQKALSQYEAVLEAALFAHPGKGKGKKDVVA